MPRRRPAEEEHENHERWLVSYADFITLMFAFFVVMYALSSLNEGKYRVLADALTSAFMKVPGSTVGAQVPVSPAMPQRTAIPSPTPSAKSEQDLRQRREKIRNIAKDIMEALAPLVRDGQVRATEGIRGITVEINASVLFAPGEASLDLRAVRSLAAVAQILAQADFPVVVEGHTDNVPIGTPQFPSNWELSVMRAASVVRLFIDSGVDPRRLTATGFAEQRPKADNATAEGRQRNRRVEITIESQTPDSPVELPLSPGH